MRSGSQLPRQQRQRERLLGICGIDVYDLVEHIARRAFVAALPRAESCCGSL